MQLLKSCVFIELQSAPIAVTSVHSRHAMANKLRPIARLERMNRRGCVIFATVLALVLGALAYIGLHGDPISDVDSVIPTMGR